MPDTEGWLCDENDTSSTKKTNVDNSLVQTKKVFPLRESSMASQQINKKQLSKPVPQGRVPPQGHAQCEVRVPLKQGIERKTGQVKSIVSPGSISAYMQMKERMKENQLREKHSGGSHQQSIVQKSHQGGSTKSLGSHLQQEPFDNDFETNYDFIMDSNECDRDDMDGEDNDLLQNGSLINQEIENEQCDALLKEKRTRLPTMCKDVHEWTIDDRRPIILNEVGKPIGPDDRTVQEGRMDTNHISDDEAACEEEAHIDHNEKEQ